MRLNSFRLVFFRMTLPRIALPPTRLLRIYSSAALTKLLLLGVLLRLTLAGVAQNPTPIGGWTGYLNFQQPIDIDWVGNEVVMVSDVGVLHHNVETGEAISLSRINGLGGASPTALHYDELTGYTYIGHQDGTLDYYQDPAKVQTLLDIRLTRNFFQRKINHITSYEGLAYIATDFGIVVIDPERGETQATYSLITEENNGKPVLAVAVFRDTLYAGMENGLFAAALNHPNLADGNAWRRVSNENSNLPPGQRCQGLAGSDNGFYALLDTTVFYKADTGWMAFVDSTDFNDLEGTKQNLRSNGNSCSIIINTRVFQLVGPEALQVGVYDAPRAARLHATQNRIAVGDILNGLIYRVNNELFRPYLDALPPSNDCVDLTAHDGKIYVGSSLRTGQYFPTYNQSGTWEWDVEAQQWQAWIPKENLPDIYSLGVVEYDETQDRLLVGTWDFGVLDIRGDTLYEIYDGTNSTLPGVALDNEGNPFAFRVAGLDIDQNGVLWVANYRTVPEPTKALSFQLPDGTWGSAILNEDDLLEVVVDQNNYKWMIIRDKGLLVLDDNNTPGNSADDRTRNLTTGVGSGDLANDKVNCMMADRDGNIWVGTGEGVSVFFNTFNIFTPGTATDAVCPIVEGRCLLNDQEVTALATDGANRKWIGTETSGAYLVSEDGTEQLLHFTVENSPLISNNIFDITVEPTTGEVFFATENGLLSYMGDATAGEEQFQDLLVFPNPVKPSFNGPLIIRGTIENATVRILTTSGKLVRELESLGGQVSWDRRDNHGNLVQEGIYVVQLADETGELTGETKFAVVGR